MSLIYDMSKHSAGKTGILLVMFGTSVEQALPGLLNIRDRMAARFQQTTIRMAFTSKIIRQIWWKRADDPAYRRSHPQIPDDILHIRSPGSVISALKEEGLDSLVIQPVQIASPAEDEIPAYCPHCTAMGTRKVFGNAYFRNISVGRPALGAPGCLYPPLADIAAVARSLAEDAARARKERAGLFYMGHGNRMPATEKAYQELAREMRRLHPDLVTVMSLVEGASGVAEAVEALKVKKVDRVLLKPFMIVAGNHVTRDMTGLGPETLKSRLEQEGFIVLTVVKGLGENPAFADIFVAHAADAARDAGILLA